jgi:phosphoadenosine phosphosulfate reductase
MRSVSEHSALHEEPLESGSNGSSNGRRNGSATLRPVPLAAEIDPDAVAADLEHRSAEDAIRWALETFHPRLYVASSFQKTTSVIVDIATKINPDTRFFYLDTDVLFEETYATRDALAERYGVEFDRFHNMTIEEQARLHGDELWKRDPDACCGIRKVEPMGEALSEVDCWVAGIRREESPIRAKAAKFGYDRRFGLWKLNPLADWTEADVWRHIRENEIPYNPLHDEGYPSIGCTHCTRKPGAGEDPRAGRWAGSDKSECGLHG